MGFNPDTSTALFLAVSIGIWVALATESVPWGGVSALVLIYVPLLARGLLYTHYAIAHVREDELRGARAYDDRENR